MKKLSLKVLIMVFLVFAIQYISFAQEEDAEGCKDHPLFNRMPNHYLGSCEHLNFGSMKFSVGQPDPKNENNIKSEIVEGKIMVFNYQIKEGSTPPSGLQIMRNFQNAGKQNGGVILGEYQGWCAGHYEYNGNDINGGTIPFGNGCTNWGTTIKFSKDNKEIWVYVQLSDDGYDMVVAEKEMMAQEIKANEMFDALNKDGFISLYINFESGKAEIKPESQPIIEQIAKMMRDNPTLKISIEGHKDNVGTPQSNQTLSENRAKAVMDAIISKGIDKNRLSSKGWGQTKPIADNKTEEGKAKNRRVEIVKK